MNKRAYSVSQVNKYIKNLFEQDFLLEKLTVAGELSNVKYHTTGHIYFTLKDEGGSINGVMFSSYARSLKVRLKEGMKVNVTGSINIYEKSGSYQIYAKGIEEDGEGDLYKRFLMLKEELLESGMFDESYKKPIPKYSKRIGIVTASTGAAIQDIINISKRRNPYVQLILYPAIVQGEYAVNSIVKGIEVLSKKDVDVIIVGRGGGSIEDLWAFNEEAVARAIFNCPKPIVSAVGHETDFTIADFVSDLRAPTPSAAAELTVFNIVEEENKLYEKKKVLTALMGKKLSDSRNTLYNIKNMLDKNSPANLLNDKRMRSIEYEERLKALINTKLQEKKSTLMLYANTLDNLSPLKKLGEGYSVITDMNDKVIASIKDVNSNDSINVNLSDGVIKATVIDKNEVDYGQ